jgi:hypothetical protein
VEPWLEAGRRGFQSLGPAWRRASVTFAE